MRNKMIFTFLLNCSSTMIRSTNCRIINQQYICPHTPLLIKATQQLLVRRFVQLINQKIIGGHHTNVLKITRTYLLLKLSSIGSYIKQVGMRQDLKVVWETQGRAFWSAGASQLGVFKEVFQETTHLHL